MPARDWQKPYYGRLCRQNVTVKSHGPPPFLAELADEPFRSKKSWRQITLVLSTTAVEKAARPSDYNTGTKQAMNNQEPTQTGVLCPVCDRTFRNNQGLGSHRVFAHERPTTGKTQARSPPSRQAPGERHIPPAGPATPAVLVWPSSIETVALGQVYGVVLLFSPATPHMYLQLQQAPPLFYSTPTSAPFHATTSTAGQGSLVHTSCSFLCAANPSAHFPSFFAGGR